MLTRFPEMSPCPVAQSYDPPGVANRIQPSSTATSGVPTGAKQSTPMCVRPRYVARRRSRCTSLVRHR